MSGSPTISIVVPNYNGAKTIGRALQSLIDQKYSQLEIIVVDGGSTDDSVEVIRSFEKYLTHWESEPDRGQAHAINKGLARCTGDVVNWLCSDDELTLGALHAVAQAFVQYPQVGVVWGRCDLRFELDPQLDRITQADPNELNDLPCRNPIYQPSTFFKRECIQRASVLDESFNYAMDFELWNYLIAQGVQWHAIDSALSIFYNSGDNKTQTGGEKILVEMERVYRRYSGEKIPATWWHRHFRLPIQKRWARRGLPKPWAPTLWYWKTISVFLAMIYGRDRMQKLAITYRAYSATTPSQDGDV